MKDDLEGKTLQELKELEQQLTHEIDVMDQMRDRQIQTAISGELIVALRAQRNLINSGPTLQRFVERHVLVLW
jgi:hypothetical protein